MANSNQARKRARQNAARNSLKASQRSDMRTSIKKVVKLLAENNFAQAKPAYQAMTSRVDKAASKGLISANKAARHKKNLNQRLKQATLQASG